MVRLWVSITIFSLVLPSQVIGASPIESSEPWRLTYRIKIIPDPIPSSGRIMVICTCRSVRQGGTTEGVAAWGGDSYRAAQEIEYLTDSARERAEKGFSLSGPKK